MRLPDLIIPNGGTESEPVDVLHITELSLFGPGTLTGVVTVEWSPDGTNWYDTGDAVTVDSITTQAQVHAESIRLTSSAAEAAERVVPMHGFGP